MQIVIDIPEEAYDFIKRTGYHTQSLYEAIKKGTLLPKGHGDLIDVNRKITISTYDEQYEEWGEKTMTVLEALNKWSDEGVTMKDVIIPADEEFKEREQEPKQRTGYWRAVYQGDEIIDYRCSECEFGNTFGKGTYGMNYCPNCGAKMEVDK